METLPGRLEFDLARLLAEARRRQTPLAPGDAVGRYSITDLLGAGAMGVVYSAFDPVLDRKVALKLLLPDGSANRRKAELRLQREARAMARLRHTNLVAVYDVGFHDASIYVAMELVDGSTLTKWLEAAPRSWRNVLDVFVAAGRGLAAAHKDGLLHRDVKPENIMVDDRGVAHVTDFGLARLTEDTRTESEDAPKDPDGLASVTRTGALMGTPAYMAPEQFAGKGIDARSDQFSLCVAAWEALYGERPFAGETPAEVATSVTTGQRRPPPPNNDVPAWVRRCLERGLSIDAAQRWPTMDALVEAMSSDPRRRRRRGLAGVAVVALLGAAALSGRWMAAGEEPCTTAAAQLQGVWDDARKDATRTALLGLDAPYAAAAWEHSSSVLDAYAADWTQTHTEACEATVVREEQPVEVMNLQMACLHRSRRELDAVADILVTADTDVALRASRLVDHLPDLTLCRDLDALRSDVVPPSPHEADAVEEARSLIAAADREQLAARYDTAEAKLVAAAARLGSGGVAYRPVYAELAYSEALLRHNLGDLNGAESALRRTLRLAGRAEQRELMGKAASRLIGVQGQLHRFDEALRWRELAEGLVEGNPRSEGEFLGSMGSVYFAKGEFETAVTFGRKMLAKTQEALGPEHREVGAAMHNLGSALADGGAFEGEMLLERALSIEEKTVGSAHPVYASTLANLASLYSQLGQQEEAAALSQRALDVYEAAEGPYHPEVGRLAFTLALIRLRGNDLDEAEALLLRSLDVAEHSSGVPRSLSDPLLGLTTLCLMSDRPADAVAYAERAVEILTDANAAPPHIVAYARFALATALGAAGGPMDRALALAHQAERTFIDQGPDHQRRVTEVQAWLHNQQML